MRYSYEFKIKCIEMYEKGEYPETPEGVSKNRFRQNIREWKKIVDLLGVGALRHKPQNKNWRPEEKLELVAKVLAGESYRSVALNNKVSHGILYKWVQIYKEKGYNGLEEQKKGRPRKVPIVKKKSTPKPLTESEREELIRLRAENEYIKAENALIKKESALRRERWAAQLKAKKQHSLKNLEKKDLN